MPVVIVLAGLFLGFMVMTAGEAAGHALWLPISLAMIGFCALALLLWHRRAMAQLHGLRLEYLTHWEQESKFRSWPKLCGWCGMRADSWKQAAIHDDPETSSCARLSRYLEQRPPGEVATRGAGPWSASATVPSEAHTGAVDSFVAPELPPGRDDS